MPKSILSRGKTIEEAVQLALNLLGATQEQVEVEVIENSGKRMFGLGVKPALVRVTRTKMDVDEAITAVIQDFEDELIDIIVDEDETSTMKLADVKKNDLAGLAWVKHGEIYCQNKESHYPVIEIGAHMKVYRNDIEVTDRCIVKEDDKMVIELDEEREETVWSIELDRHHRFATLHVKPGFYRQYQLKDHPPATKIKLETESQSFPLLQLKKNDILAKLDDLNVTYGIDQELIERACASLEEGHYQIVTGKEPEKGEHGKVSFLVEVDEKNLKPLERSDGSVDFRETNFIPTIDEGTVFAIIEPPLKGKDGKSILGEVLPAQEAVPIIVRTGKGAMYLEEDHKLIATVSGRPEVKRQGRMIRASVLPKFIHSGDVNIGTGNIHFSGDVEVLGNVEENMLIDTDGDVWIKKNVMNAKIQSGNSIKIEQNAINSKLEAGKSNMIVAKLGHKLGMIQQELIMITSAIKQIYQVNAFKNEETSDPGLSSVLKILLEQKFNSFNHLIKEFVEQVKKHRSLLDDEWVGLSNRFRSGFLLLPPEGFRDIADLEKMNRFVKHVYEISILPPEPNASITCSYALNSEIYCSGNIMIKGKGAYNSKIHAGGVLEIDGVFVTGDAYAGLGAKIKVTGSKAGVKTKIQVPADQVIEIETAMGDTIIQIGNRSHTFAKETHYIKARLTKEHKLLLH
ncbi:flagellar assembly protein A [Halalkalibacter urbisdiaboli]|uniref:flagellar assembly protein A n=1 Tax=Halalkalibacter urbisdiaboli TaxID=1960589 RepID=UPI0013FDE06B|nr:flagellar assembly protein A [Halalkalibacter urbisdiaboli]